MGFYVYILRCSDGSYYVGHSDDLETRIAQHSQGLIAGYTHTRRPVSLVFAGEFATREDALGRERQIKGWSRAKKEALIRGNWERLRRLTRAFSAKDVSRPLSAQASISSAFAGPGEALRPFGFAQDRQAQGERLDVGKLPNEMLARLLARVQLRDPRVILGPGIGRDAAVIDQGGPKLLVAKSDPITFATDLIGHYAVHVNANDVACMGARPAWFLATVLLPERATAALAESVFDQILDACQALGIELVGGHTEITYRLERPIVIGALLGEVERDRLVSPDGARPDDALILTKGIAIEGTSLLAREAGDRLQALGVSTNAARRAKAFIRKPGISVVAEAMAACQVVRVHAMHDPTEGGLSTALYELAEASGCGIVVRREQIEVLPQTRILCEAAGLDPMGLLASGALLLAVAPEDGQQALQAIDAAGVSARQIGWLAGAEEGVIIEDDKGRAPLARFARDEVARFLTEPGE